MNVTQRSITALDQFCSDYKLTPYQKEQFAAYLHRLKDENEHFNITTITDDADIVYYHFQDSIVISKYVDFSTITTIADVGTGGGFPGIPLAILYPQVHIILIEVSEKKLQFLTSVIAALQLNNVELCSLDWRTFLRKTAYSIDLFVSRASLHPDELLKVFKPSSPYKDATLVYWASKQWQPTKEEKKHLVEEKVYEVGNKERKLIFFRNVEKFLK